MKVEEGKYSILKLTDWFRRKELVVNSEYQRGAGLWPTAAKSYFIDTVLKGFPFPKVYFYERMDKETRRPRREIVDGQQRITTLVEFGGLKRAESLTAEQRSEIARRAVQTRWAKREKVKNPEK